MRVASLFVLFAFAAVPAYAVTKAQENLVPVAPSCTGAPTGTCNNGVGSCTADANCNIGSMLNASKFQMDGHLLLKATIKKVTDASGMPVTTDGTAGTADDYILRICVTAFVPGSVDACIYLHADLKNGNGTLNVSGSPLASLFPAGSPVQFNGARFYRPPTNPAGCPGNNDTTNSSAFISNQVSIGTTKPACETGGFVGTGGIQNGL